MSSWCWSKELVLLSFVCFHCLSPHLLACVSQSAEERDVFFTESRYKRLGMILPCWCCLPLSAKGASITDLFSVGQMI